MKIHQIYIFFKKIRKYYKDETDESFVSDFMFVKYVYYPETEEILEIDKRTKKIITTEYDDEVAKINIFSSDNIYEIFDMLPSLVEVEKYNL